MDEGRGDVSDITYPIRGRQGDVLAFHVRELILENGQPVIKDDGKPAKEFKWRQPNGAIGLNGQPVADLLYGLEMLDQYPDVSTVVITEGEKAADALNAIGFLALATVCGAASVPSRDALANLAGRRVILWPDADPAPDPVQPDRYPDGKGRWHMNEIAAILTDLDIEVSIVEWPEAPSHGDAADLIEPGCDTPAAVKDAVQLVPFIPPTGGEATANGRPFKLTREETDPPVYVMHWPVMTGGRWTSEVGRCTLRLGPAAIQRWATVLTAWLTQQRGTPPWVPTRSEPYMNVLGELLDAMSDEDFIEPPPELTNAGRVRVVLGRLCGGEPPDDPSDPRAGTDQLDRGEPWWDLETGRVHFSFASLVKLHFAETAPGDRLKRDEMKRAVESMGGAVSVRFDLPADGRRRQRRASWVPWKAFLG